MIGEILDGKYRIDKQLGAGGMGNVYLATHLGTTRVVAVKVIAPRWAKDPHFLARFQREAQACGRLRHPNIINVTDFGVARSARGDMPYLVMEFLDGETLSDFQKAHPRPTLPLIADLLDQIGLALVEAHGHGIVHRDLKPDNIWLEPNGRGGYTVKVLDFGVAKMNLLGNWSPEAKEPAESGEPVTPTPRPALPGDALETAVMDAPPTPDETATAVTAPIPTPIGSRTFDSDASGHTMPGSMVGTPAFMSPEQALGKETDYRSDIYSLAVVAYTLVCGALPFTGKTSELFEFHQSGSPLPPASVEKVPRDVSDAVMAGLARDPADRPASAIALTRRIHNAVDAEFLALRRSKAFLLQHLAAYAFLLPLIYGTVVGATAILMALGGHLIPPVRVVLIPLVAAVFFVFSDNVLRAASALIARDEQVRIRRFMSFRVLWKLIKMTPALVMTQVRALWLFGPGWVTGDCLWPVVCVVERLRGKAAILRSRELMKGLESAGRALAIRHLALAALAIVRAFEAVVYLWRSGDADSQNVVLTACWFPVFVLFSAAPLFLYDRTAANESGPLLQLDRTPEVRTTARAFSLSSIMWLAVGALYLLYQPIKVWLFK